MQIDFSLRPTIFLSCASNSQATTDVVRDKIMALGGEVVGFSSSQSVEQFEEALATAVASVIIVSDASLSSTEQMSEWSQIQSKAWQDPDFKIIPILERGVEIPPFLSKWQSIRIEDLKNELTTALDELLKVDDNTVELAKEQLDRSKERFKSMHEKFESSAKSLPEKYSSAVKKYFDGDE